MYAHTAVKFVKVTLRDTALDLTSRAQLYNARDYTEPPIPTPVRNYAVRGNSRSPPFQLLHTTIQWEIPCNVGFYSA